MISFVFSLWIINEFDKVTMLLVYMYDYNSNISILFLKKNQNYTKLIALHIATKLIKGDNTDTKRKETQ